ncbi:MAG TPA: hypothetical protein VFP05_10685 [Thermomicrobiales bacterium]|nr:hypothetical protein [Thermomicrobiales bacterium]
MSFPEDNAPEGRGSSPEDVATAARGCQAILILGFVIVLLIVIFIIAQQF